ncbi:hypothetical protein [Vibrio cyclitrophicus]|uniref:hypothetical protein n=1 Tax=Vibrio cyclitrophicus TaxID=47951 RepID=UPI000C82947B|nr:hypothetical protein [Vibrio cyclitrophicus]PMF46863.1 hypothetical protein BCV14_13380 [Vibrio cyclitrophicus]
MRSDSSFKNLTSKKHIDPQTGQAHVHYFWKRNKVPLVEITGKLPNKLSGLTLIQKDLGNALKWMQLAQNLAKGTDITGNFVKANNRETFDVIKALFVASLTFYGKCFTEANGRNAQASRNWLDEDYKELHDYYMNFRHNFAAHSGDEKIELAKTFVLLHPKKKQELLPFLPTIRLQPDVVLPRTDSEEKGLEDLIVYVSKLVTERYNKLSQKIIHDLVLVEETAYWREKAKQNKPVELGFPKKKT